MSKRLYFKVYQDIENCDKNSPYYIDSFEGIQNSISVWMSEFEQDEMPVIIPIMLTEQEFKSLPEFEGF